MKAAEVLRLYEAGERDFSGESLRGQNFKGKDLAGADFTGADIRSTNFTNANLTGVKFSRAQAGLQRRWAFGLALALFVMSVLSGVLSSYSGFLVDLILNSGDPTSQVIGWCSLAVVVVFLLVLLRKGVGVLALAVALAVALALAVAFAGVLALTVALAVAVAGALAVALAGAIALALTVALAEAVAGAVAGVLAGALALAAAGVLAGVIALAGAGAGAVNLVGALAGALAVTLVSTYVGWRALSGDERDAWIRSVAIAFSAIGGTNFRGATLTDADFSQARLKSTDFRRAFIRRTLWRDAENLDRVRPGESYLNNPKVRQLLVSGDGQGQRFDRSLDLKGINLRGANLADADFCGSTLRYGTLEGANLTDANLKHTNLNNVNLRDVNLSRALLKQAQLDQADLTGATLTGACIEDWGITTRTRLHGIQCAYVFMHSPSKESRNPNPCRKPDDWSKTFAEGEFVDFITPMVETLDLYHNQSVDPRAVAIAFSDLRQQNPNADLEIISMEKRGQNLDKFNLRVRTRTQADRSQLHHQYFDRYEHLLTLSPQALVALLMEKEEKSQMLAGMVGTAINRPGTQIENTYQTQGDTIVSEQGSNAPKYDMRGAQFAGGFAETIQGDQVGGTINNQASETPSLAEAAAEIQNLLKQLEASNPTATEVEQTAYLSAMIPPTKRERFIGALTAAGGAAIEEVPYGAVLKALVEGWQKPGG